MISMIFIFILDMISNLANTLLAPLNLLVSGALSVLGGVDLSLFKDIVDLFMKSAKIIGYVIGRMLINPDLLLALVSFYLIRKNYNKILSTITFVRNVIKNFKVI
jgi:hypothetical protein